MKVSPRRDWGMLFALFLVLTVVAVTLGGVAIWTLYSAGLEHEKKSLAAVVKIEVDRIEAAIRSEQTPIDDLKLIPPLGESGELFVFRQDVEGPEVIRHWANHVTSLSSADREAIVNSDMFRLALSGQSGIHEGRDFRGNEVVAAYAPVAGLGMGVVGKIDISEFRAPFFTAAQGVAGVSIVLIALGTVVFLYLSDSILQRIRAGEARFRELFEHLNSGVAIYLYSDQDGKLTVKDLNRAAEQILNVDRSAVVGLSVAEAFPGLKAAGLTDVLYRVAKSGEVEQFPEWFYHDERGSGWRKSYVFRLPSGEVVSLFDDITKKKKNEEELRESEARWRSIFDLQSVATIIVDREKKIRFLNRAAEALFGYPNEKLVGVPFGYPVLGGDVAQIDIVRPTGSVVYAEMETIPMQWGGEEHHLLFLRDVSAHRRAEGDLRKLFQAIEQSPAAVVITNIEGNIEYVNPKFTEVSGYAYPEVVGKNPRILKSGLTPPEVYEDLWKTITRGDVWVGEFQNKRKSGEFFWELASIAPVKNVRGETTHFVGVKENITERKITEERLRHAQKMQAIGELTGGIAHDFNNLLAIIIGNLQLLEESLEDNPEHKELIADALWSVERGSELTSRLLAFARRQHLKPEMTDVNEVIRGMTNLLRRTLGERIKIIEILAEDLGNSMIDRGQLENAVLNLVVNARDAMKNGGVLTISTRNATLEPNEDTALEHAAGDYTVVEVHDTGIGMPPEIAERVFEPFFTTKKFGKGSGLGLSMVYGFVTQSGGHVEVDSEEGKGTTMSLFLPRELPEEEAMKA